MFVLLGFELLATSILLVSFWRLCNMSTILFLDDYGCLASLAAHLTSRLFTYVGAVICRPLSGCFPLPASLARCLMRLFYCHHNPYLILYIRQYKDQLYLVNICRCFYESIDAICIYIHIYIFDVCMLGNTSPYQIMCLRLSHCKTCAPSMAS